MDEKFKSWLITLVVGGLFTASTAGVFPGLPTALGASGQGVKSSRKKTTKRSPKPAPKTAAKPTPTKPIAAPQAPAQQIDKAIAEFEQGDVEKARTLLEMALSSAPIGNTAAIRNERARALLWLAHYNVLIGQGEAATREFHKALDQTKDVNTQAALCQKAVYDLDWDVLQPGLALQAAELGAECAQHMGDPRLLGQMRERQGAFLWSIGARAGAIEVWESLWANDLKVTLNPSEEFWINYRLILAYAGTGNEDLASRKVPQMRQAAQAATKASGDSRLTIYADFCDGYRYLLSGLSSQAPEKFQSAWKLLQAQREAETELRVVLPAFWSIACRKKEDLAGAANALRLAQNGLSRLPFNHAAHDLVTLAAADLLAAQSRPDEALRLLRERLDNVEKVSMAGWPLVENMECHGIAQRVYRAYVARLCAAGQFDEALTWTEKARLAALRSMLESGNILPQRGMSEAQRVEEGRRVGQLRLARWRARGKGQTVGATADSAVLSAIENLRRLRLALQAQNPVLAGLRGWPVALKISDWLPEDTALLVYEFCDVTLAGLSQDVMDVAPTLFVATIKEGRSQVHHYALKATLGKSRDAALALEKTVKELSFAYADPQNGNGEAQASSLYETLLKPAVADLEGKQSLLLCPHGVLWDVPFAALQSGATLVLDKWQIAYAPSLSFAAQSLREAPPKKTAGDSLLIIVNPAFGGAERFVGEGQAETAGARSLPITADGRALSMLGRGLTANGFGPHSASRAIVADARGLLAEGRGLFAEGRSADATSSGVVSGKRGPGRGAFRPDNALWPLPGTRLEVEAIQKIWPRATLWSGEQVQESAFKAQTEKFAYWHIATHAICSDGAPLFSWIAFAKPVTLHDAPIEDGLLTAHEIFDLNWPTRNVTLSATALFGMRHTTGSGAVLFLSALQSAGTRTQTLTRWPSDEVAAASFVKVYYGALQEGASTSASLRRAILEVRKNHSHPYYWANWMLSGDWR